MDLIDKSKKMTIKFWKSVPSYVLVRQYKWRKKITLSPVINRKNLKNVLFYRQQIAYTGANYLPKYFPPVMRSFGQ